jgi:hypothetical protein
MIWFGLLGCLGVQQVSCQELCLSWQMMLVGRVAETALFGAANITVAGSADVMHASLYRVRDGLQVWLHSGVFSHE